MKFNRDLMTRYVEALESGAYLQGHGQLCRVDPATGHYTYDPLGLLEQVRGVHAPRRGGWMVAFGDQIFAANPDTIEDLFPDAPDHWIQNGTFMIDTEYGMESVDRLSYTHTFRHLADLLRSRFLSKVEVPAC